MNDAALLNSRHYSLRWQDSTGCPIVGAMAERGIGKTFGEVIKAIEHVAWQDKRFVYVVETLEMVKTLSQNKGEKFFAKILKHLKTYPTRRNKALLKAIQSKTGEVTEVTEGDVFGKIQGGTITIQGRTAGYMIAFNDFANMKRNNFIDIKDIIVDEFVSENLDIRSTRNAYKLSSLIQSVARLDEVRIVLLCNAIRIDDPILQRLGLSNMRVGERRIIKDEYGPLLAFEYVDNSKYAEFTEEADASVAGRFSKLLGEDNLERNEFKNICPPELLIPKDRRQSNFQFCLHGPEDISVRIHATKDYSEYYCLYDYGVNTRKRYCIDRRLVSGVVSYHPEYKDNLIRLYEAGKIKFDTGLTHVHFKTILNLDLN